MAKFKDNWMWHENMASSNPCRRHRNTSKIKAARTVGKFSITLALEDKLIAKVQSLRSVKARGRRITQSGGPGADTPSPPCVSDWGSPVIHSMFRQWVKVQSPLWQDIQDLPQDPRWAIKKPFWSEYRVHLTDLVQILGQKICNLNSFSQNSMHETDPIFLLVFQMSMHDVQCRNESPATLGGHRQVGQSEGDAKPRQEAGCCGYKVSGIQIILPYIFLALLEVWICT